MREKKERNEYSWSIEKSTHTHTQRHVRVKRTRSALMNISLHLPHKFSVNIYCFDSVYGFCVPLFLSSHLRVCVYALDKRKRASERSSKIL